MNNLNTPSQMSKLKQFTIKATIPTGQYANIQPEITVEAESFDDAKAVAMLHIEQLHAQYGSVPLNVNTGGDWETLRSFNENVDVLFNPVTHKYEYEGEPLMSASGFVEKYTPKFDKVGMSEKCAPKWGVPANEIQEIWTDNGAGAGSFGTAVHLVLENYFKHKKAGEIIQEKKQLEENYAIPNHPFLRRLVLDLERLLVDFKGETHQEVLVSSVKENYCGLVDRLLVTGDKTCRVQDYKITYDIEKPGTKFLEPFSDLSPTKLSKYLIQLSFYANLLEKSGWTVEGLDIFNFDGEWHHHELKQLKVLT